MILFRGVQPEGQFRMNKTTIDDFQTKPSKQMLQSDYYHSLQK